MRTLLKENQGISTKLLMLITLSTAFSVANIYYSQPLLSIISHEFGISEFLSNSITMSSQIGYALGLFFIIPLGDMLNRRKIILTNFFILSTALIVISVSSNIYLTLMSSFIIGLTSVTPQIFIPLVSQYALPENKGRDIGIVVSGLLVGILSSRVISGFVGEHFGWRTMYYVAAIVMLLFFLLILCYFPDTNSNFTGKYKKLMSSIFSLIKEEPKLIFAALKAGLAFGSFLSLWAMLAFKMAQAPFFAGGTIVGFLGLCGVAGALSASFIGKYVKAIGLYRINFIGAGLMILAWFLLYTLQYTYAGIIIGIILLDIGMQCIQLGNQTTIFELRPKAVNRINTIFMTCYFIGGATGTFLTGIAWGMYEWTGVVFVGVSLITASLLINSYHYLYRRNL